MNAKLLGIGDLPALRTVKVWSRVRAFRKILKLAQSPSRGVILGSFPVNSIDHVHIDLTLGVEAGQI